MVLALPVAVLMIVTPIMVVVTFQPGFSLGSLLWGIGVLWLLIAWVALRILWGYFGTRHMVLRPGRVAIVRNFFGFRFVSTSDGGRITGVRLTSTDPVVWGDAARVYVLHERGRDALLMRDPSVSHALECAQYIAEALDVPCEDATLPEDRIRESPPSTQSCTVGVTEHHVTVTLRPDEQALQSARSYIGVVAMTGIMGLSSLWLLQFVWSQQFWPLPRRGEH